MMFIFSLYYVPGSVLSVYVYSHLNVTMTLRLVPWLASFCRWGDWGPERLSNAKVTNREGVQISSCCTPVPHGPFHPVVQGSGEEPVGCAKKVSFCFKHTRTDGEGEFVHLLFSIQKTQYSTPLLCIFFLYNVSLMSLKTSDTKLPLCFLQRARPFINWF